LTFDTPFDVKSEKIADASRFPFLPMFYHCCLQLLLTAINSTWKRADVV
jgi:hypothetical protein